MCAGMFVVFGVSSSAAATSYDSGEFDGSKGWISSITIQFPTEGDDKFYETDFSRIYVDGKSAVGMRMKYNPVQDVFRFEYELHESQKTPAGDGWSQRAMDTNADGSGLAWSVGELVLYFYHNPGADEGLLIKGYNAGQLIYKSVINDDATDDINWKWKDNTDAVIGAMFDNEKVKVEFKGNEAQGVKIVRGNTQIGWDSVDDKMVDNWTEAATLTGGKFEALFQTGWQESATLWYWIEGEGFKIGGRVCVWNQFIDVYVQILGDKWTQNFKTTEEHNRTNIFSFVVESDGEQGVIKVLEAGETIFEYELNDESAELFTDDNVALSGVSEFGDFWSQKLKVSMKWETNPTNAELSKGVIKVNEQPSATTAAATTAPSVTPTPTPTTGDAMFAVVALAVVAVAGTAIVSKKRK